MTSQRLVKCKLRKVRELFRLKKHEGLIFGEKTVFFSQKQIAMPAWLLKTILEITP